MERFYTLITGASSGIGKSLALECAKRGMNVILVSRPSERLTATAEEIRASCTVDVRYFAIDLTENDAPQSIYNWCNNEGLRVNYLINNAGTVGTVPFEQSDAAYLDSIIMLNIRALTILIRLFLPELKKIPGSKILNIGSMSGFFPIPYKGAYAASKAYVHSLSKSLETELKGSGVGVFLVAPNGVRSNPRVTERIKDHKLIGKFVSMECDEFARLALDKVANGKKFYVPLFANKLLFFLSRILPDALMMNLLMKEFRKELKSE